MTCTHCHNRSVRCVSCYRKKYVKIFLLPRKWRCYIRRQSSWWQSSSPETCVPVQCISGYIFSDVFPSPTAADLWLFVQSPGLIQISFHSQHSALCLPPPIVQIFNFPFAHYIISPPLRAFKSLVASGGFCQNHWRQTSFVLLFGSAPDAFTVILTLTSIIHQISGRTK